jgi:imidazolonepropionase-like amidohydrolase
MFWLVTLTTAPLARRNYRTKAREARSMSSDFNIDFSQLTLTLLLAALAPSSARAEDQLIRQVRVFDGERSLESVSVLVRDGRIAAVGPSLAAPGGARVIDGSGRTLLPGLIDAHTHIRSNTDLEKSLAYGITTDFSLNMDPQLAARLKAEQAAGKAPDRADLFSAGSAATAPRGHGTEFGWAVPTLTEPGQAQAWVDARLAEGSDFIKIIYEHGGENGRVVRPSIDQPVMAALIVAAHARGKLAVVHIHTAEQASDAIAAGADGLAHLYLSGADEVTPELVGLIARSHAFVIPTLTLLQSVCGLSPGRGALDDPRLRAFLLSEDAATLERSIDKAAPADCDRPMKVTAMLAAVHVPILAGTDEPKPGVVPGASLHVELASLVAAGLTPSAALRAATSAVARAFRLTDRGLIAPGRRADLLLVDGDPTSDIKATRSIVAVWKGGVRFDRDAWLAHAKPAAP